eukprot:14147-Heterococcus_DN1.PRE.3
MQQHPASNESDERFKRVHCVVAVSFGTVSCSLSTVCGLLLPCSWLVASDTPPDISEPTFKSRQKVRRALTSFSRMNLLPTDFLALLRDRHVIQHLFMESKDEDVLIGARTASTTSTGTHYIVRRLSYKHPNKVSAILHGAYIQQMAITRVSLACPAMQAQSRYTTAVDGSVLLEEVTKYSKPCLRSCTPGFADVLARTC